MSSKNTMFKIDGVAAHLVDQPHLGAPAVERGVDLASTPCRRRRFALSSGVVRASSGIFVAVCAVEVHILVPLTT